MENKTPQEIQIPEWFEKWLDSEMSKHEKENGAWCDGQCAFWYETAALSMYHHLSATAVQGDRWVRVTDRLPDRTLETVHCRTKYGRAVNKFAEGKFWWLDSKEVWQPSENTLEWLEEISTPSPCIQTEEEWEGKLVEFLDWFLLNYMNSRGATKNSSSIVVERFLNQKSQ